MFYTAVMSYLSDIVRVWQQQCVYTFENRRAVKTADEPSARQTQPPRQVQVRVRVLCFVPTDARTMHDAISSLKFLLFFFSNAGRWSFFVNFDFYPVGYTCITSAVQHETNSAAVISLLVRVQASGGEVDVRRTVLLLLSLRLAQAR